MSTPPAPRTDRWRTTSPYRLVVFTVALVAGLWKLPTLLPVLVAGLLAVGFALLMDVPVRALGRLRVGRWRVGRPVATGVVMLAVLAAGAGLVLGVLPEIRTQVSGLAAEHGSILTQLAARIDDAAAGLHLPVHVDGSKVAGWLGHVNLTGVASNAVNVVTVPLLALMAAAWAVASPEPLRARLLAFVPPARRPGALAVADAALDRLRRWAFGVGTMSLAMGLLTYAALRLLGVPFSLLFAVVAGLCEMVPIIGVLLGAVGPVALTLLEHPGRLPALLIGIVVAHQLEDRLLSPLVMRRAVDIPPTLIAFAVFGFGALLGPLGALIALPVTAVAITVHDALTGADPDTVHDPADPAHGPADPDVAADPGDGTDPDGAAHRDPAAG